MMNGKILDLRSTLWSCGITDGCTVHVHYRLRGGTREDVPGQWTCSQCFTPRCWPVPKRCYRCGAAREGMCRPQHVGHKSCLLEVRLELGLGDLQLLKRHIGQGTSAPPECLDAGRLLQVWFETGASQTAGTC